MQVPLVDSRPWKKAGALTSNGNVVAKVGLPRQLSLGLVARERAIVRRLFEYTSAILADPKCHSSLLPGPDCKIHKESIQR